MPFTWIEHVASPLPRECSTTELKGHFRTAACGAICFKPCTSVILQHGHAGAGEGNRTLVISLEGFCSTIELHPRGLPLQSHTLKTLQLPCIPPLALRPICKTLFAALSSVHCAGAWPAAAASNFKTRILAAAGGGGWIRTSVLVRGQIYSLLPLTTRPPLRREPQTIVESLRIVNSPHGRSCRSFNHLNTTTGGVDELEKQARRRRLKKRSESLPCRVHQAKRFLRCFRAGILRAG